MIRQGIKSTIVQYAGVAIGAVANLFLYTTLKEEYGLVQVLIVIANVILPFAMLGSYSLAVKFYPRFKNPDAGRQGFLTLLLLIAGVGIGLYLATWGYLDNWLQEVYLSDTREDYRQYIKYIPAFVILLALIKLLFQYTSNFRLITIPTLLEQFMLKVTLPILLVCFLLGWLTIEQVVIGVVANYALALIGMLIHLAKIGELKLPKPTKNVLAERKNMAGFAGYGIASMLGTQLAFRVDVVMVTSFLGFGAAGQYTIVLFIAEVISKPYSNVRSVLAPEVSASWKENDRNKLRTLYQSSSKNLLMVSAYMFGGILVCFESLTVLASNGDVLAGAFGAFVALGLSRMVDSATSINEYIISFSDRYHFNLVAILVLAVTNIALNNYLIPLYGITGAGIATLISITLYNLAKVLFAGFAFHLWPFGKTTLEIALVFAAIIAGVYYTPNLGIWWLDILWRGGLLTFLIATYAWWRAPSAEVKGIMRTVLSKIVETSRPTDLDAEL